MGARAPSASAFELQRWRLGADVPVVDRRIVGIFILVGSTLGGFAPEAWGGSAFGFASLTLGCLGGAVGLWLALRLTG
jgi:hypothetical protein